MANCILLIGKPNSPFKDLHNYLKDKGFYVQFCNDDAAMIQDTLKVLSPDVAVVSLIGIQHADPRIYGAFINTEVKCPVITIGTEYEWNALPRRFTIGRFENLIRPVSNETVYAAICSKLNIKKPRKKVLVVDDDGGLLRMMKTMLEDRYDVMLASSGARAVASIGRERPDVILLDYEMPVCDGRQTLEMLKTDSEMQDIPVIFLTSVTDMGRIKALVDLKPSGYMVKPPVKKTTVMEIEKALREHEKKYGR